MLFYKRTKVVKVPSRKVPSSSPSYVQYPVDSLMLFLLVIFYILIICKL